MELPILSDGPVRQWQIETSGQFFRGGGQVGVLHRAEFAELRCEERRRGGERGGVVASAAASAAAFGAA